MASSVSVLRLRVLALSTTTGTILQHLPLVSLRLSGTRWYAASKEDQVIQESIKKSLENPDTVATPSERGESKTLHITPREHAREHPRDPSLDYSKFGLNRDNIMVDTNALIKIYIVKGFSSEQAECLTYTFTQLMNDALKEQRKICVEKAALDIMREQVMAHIGALRKDMVILEKSELSDLRNENEKLKLMLGQAKSQINEDLNKVKSQITLDINMERSRAKDDHTSMEKSLAELKTKMTEHIGTLETTFERYKNDIYKWIAGSLVSAITVGFTIYRIVNMTGS